jgi:glycerol kinase
VAAIGITNQRETVIVWERATGKAIHPAIVWQDRRTAAVCVTLEASGVGDDGFVKPHRAGAGPVFSATKLAWILDNVARARGPGPSGASWPLGPWIAG